MTSLSIDLFGGFEVRTDAGPVALGSKRTDALFAYLLLTREQHSREHLGDLLWDTGSPARAAGNLRVLLTNLRRCLGPCVEISRTTVQFRPPPEWEVTVDLDGFRSMATAIVRKPVSTLSATDLVALEEATALGRGGLLDRLEVPGCPRFDDWLSAERATVHHERVCVLTHLVEGQIALGQAEAAVESATRLRGLDPLSEAPRAALIRARVATGDVVGARHEYELLESMLRSELGVTPSQETRAVLDRAERKHAATGGRRTHRRRPPRSSRAEPRERAPWSRFVGRQAELAKIVQGYAEVLQGRGTVVVVRGETGSGKTMLLRQASQLLLRQDRSVAVLGASCGSFPASSGPASSLYCAHVLGQLDGDPSGPWLGASMSPTVAARLAELDALAHLAGMPASSDAARLVSAVRQLSTERPVVLVADDLQWADDATLQVLADLAQDLRTRPVLILVATRSARAEQPLRANRLLARLSRGRNDVLLDLDPASPADAHAFVEALIASEQHDLPDTFVRQLADLGGGHPQTTIETLRDLARRRVLDTGSDGRYVLTGAPDMGVPERVGRMLDEQLQDLPEAHAVVVEAAAVCGQHFDVRVVAALCDRSLEDVIRVVGGRPGAESRLFAPVTTLGPDGPGSSTHRFRHPLMDQHIRAGMDRVWLDHLEQTRRGLESTREAAPWARRRPAVALPHVPE